MLRLLTKNAIRALGLVLLLSGIVNVAYAAVAPEIDPASASSAIAIIAGAALLAHDKFRQR